LPEADPINIVRHFPITTGNPAFYANLCSVQSGGKILFSWSKGLIKRLFNRLSTVSTPACLFKKSSLFAHSLP